MSDRDRDDRDRPSEASLAEAAGARARKPTRTTRRRSLRVPVDEVPRKSLAGGDDDGLPPLGAESTQVTADPERRSRELLPPRSAGQGESALQSSEEVALDPDLEMAELSDDDDGPGDLESEPTRVAPPRAPSSRPPPAMPAMGSAPPSIQIDASLERPRRPSSVPPPSALGFAVPQSSTVPQAGPPSGPPTFSARPKSEPAPAPAEARAKSEPAPASESAPAPAAQTAAAVAVVVARVVRVTSPPPAPGTDADVRPWSGGEASSPEVAIDDVDIEVGDAARASDPDLPSADLEEVAEVAPPPPPPRARESARSQPRIEAVKEPAPASEEEELAPDDLEVDADAKTKGARSAPPPPPEKQAPPAPPKAARAPEPPQAKAAAEADANAQMEARRAKRKANWWEDLFNDDYLRTVPPPNPKQIARQCDFIEGRLKLKTGSTILDVGCGLGLHAVELTRRGYLVVGLDLSLPMLSRAADEAQDQGFRINFLHADMREMNFEGAFDAVLCIGTTLGYFDDDQNKAVVERLYRALKPKGVLLLDVVNRDFVFKSQPNLVWFEGDGCVVMEETSANYITSRLLVKRTVILDDGRQRDNTYSVRLYALHELGQILHHRGFRVGEVSGREATPGVFFGADSPRLIIVAERRPNQAAPPTPPKKGEEATGPHAAVSADAAPEVEGAPTSEVAVPATEATMTPGGAPSPEGGGEPPASAS